VESRRPTQVVADLHEPGPGPWWHADVVSCRLNALLECNAHPIPVFSPVDEVTPVEGYSLADYMWVEVPTSRLRSPLATMAWDGERWYSKAECQFLLEAGIAKWEDFKLALHATAHRSPGDLAAKLRFMREVWQSTATTFAGQCWAGEKQATRLLPKAAMLALLGAWGRTKNFAYQTITSNHPDDCPVTGEISSSPAPGSECFHDITWRSEVRSLATFLPLNLAARALERLNVARAIRVCMKYMQPSRILSIQVDAICFEPPKKRARRCVEELQGLRYADLHAATRRPLARFAGPIQDPIRSTERVYQLKQLEAPLRPGGELARQTAERPAVSARPWTIHREPLEGPDDFGDRIIAHLLAGGCCTIVGAPGTGKSFLLGRIRDALAEREKVQTLAPTNAAARLVLGQTCHTFAAKMSAARHGFSGTLLIDEVSMLSLAIVAQLDNLRLGECRVVTLGDWGQLPPVGNSWRGQPVAPTILQDSALLKAWSGHTLFELRRCRRSDAAHFAFYTQLGDDRARAVAAARARFPRGCAQTPGLHLCVSHRRRRAINAIRQGSVGVGIPPHDGEPGYAIAPGTPLVGSCTAHGFVNGAFYETLQASAACVKVLDRLTGATIEVAPDRLARHTCLAHAVVYNRAQGCTVPDTTVILWDLEATHATMAHLYVGLSRVCSGAQIRSA